MAAVIASTMRCVDVPDGVAGLATAAARGVPPARGDRDDRGLAGLIAAPGDNATESGGRGILASTGDG
jgi:hypothetical protein